MQGLQAALEYLRTLHQAGPHQGGRGLSTEEVEHILMSLSQEAVRRIVEFMREAANTRRDADERVNAEVRAQMRVVLGSITRNLHMIENRANSASVRQYAHQLVSEAQGVDYHALIQRNLARVDQRALDQYPDVGMPQIEEVVNSPRVAGGRVVKKALKNRGRAVPTRSRIRK